MNRISERDRLGEACITGRVINVSLGKSTQLFEITIKDITSRGQVEALTKHGDPLVFPLIEVDQSTFVS